MFKKIFCRNQKVTELENAINDPKNQMIKLMARKSDNEIIAG
jgi:hypothetical protein